ncbi:MAG: non-canonical purine NTP pyrophosphatase [Treponema sp.]|nr:non-canonical purine NTP pyrophosphatase [Treponema sp.]
MTLWFATGNAHKKMELAAILTAGIPDGFCEIRIPADAGLEFDPEENGNSFYENALLKARELSRLLLERRPPQYSPGDPVIADDSGLCVDALNGRPGILSARYAGAKGSGGRKKLSAGERNALLLAELGDKPLRSARFVCAMALLFSDERFFLVQETVEGEIVRGAEQAKGAGGFGYDPVFFIPCLGKTMAELSEEEKNQISHRGKAGRMIAVFLEKNYFAKGVCPAACGEVG